MATILNSGHFFIVLTLLLTVYGQLVLKWQVSLAVARGQEAAISTVRFYLNLLLNPWVLSAFFAAFLASVTWMATVSRMDLSRAYPFMAINFVLILIFSYLLFSEPLSTFKVVGSGVNRGGRIRRQQGIGEIDVIPSTSPT